MFEWIKDKTYYRKKANTLKLENELQRKAHAHNTIEWTKQIEDKEADIQYRDTRIKLLNGRLKKYEERIKELETPKKKKW